MHRAQRKLVVRDGEKRLDELGSSMTDRQEKIENTSHVSDLKHWSIYRGMPHPTYMSRVCGIFNVAGQEPGGRRHGSSEHCYAGPPPSIRLAVAPPPR